MKLINQLKQLGLQDSEASVYLFLLNQGLATPPQVAKGTGIARTNTYHLLRSLKEKGLIEEQPQRKRKAYVARDPQALLMTLERHRELAEELLPDLRALHATQKNKPKIQFFEGWEEIKQIYRQTLSAEIIRAIGSAKKLAAVDEKFLAQYQKDLNKNKVLFCDILTSDEKTTRMIQETRGPLHDIKVLPRTDQEIQTDMLIWGDHVALICLEEPMFGTVLTSPIIAQAFRVIHEVMWKALKVPYATSAL